MRKTVPCSIRSGKGREGLRLSGVGEIVQPPAPPPPFVVRLIASKWLVYALSMRRAATRAIVLATRTAACGAPATALRARCKALK